ncbi:hypothetical protein [Aureibacter tunicatorum]|uniref:Uncharacterized protein n=1 Tax=Aureibacter tunicatorum TaxID=866807 RepID=A0AAE3XNV0_9BACT|nr:hypothetical protein [Aureibacter tunicatorum]MDR6239930.1 hypothetical protein [Aureibacter tunicatorum]BDD04405.1 hypothetical protein AUTU_18880 [Aureibacter tunicatorum]
MNNLEKSRLKLVKDEYIGELFFLRSNNCWTFKLREDYKSKFVHSEGIKSDNVIAVILESPHIYEFENLSLSCEDGKKYYSRPLNNNKSREALINILQKIMTSFYEKSKKYEVVLINAIQFQNSLGKNLDSDENIDIRNENWIKNWIDYNIDFINRVKSVSPKLIFNLCTQGSYKLSNCKNVYQNLDDEYIQKFGLKFTNTKSDKVLFEVRRQFGYEKFTLQDVVEYKLEQKGCITNDNYCKYYHPSKFTHDKKPTYPSLEDKNKINFSKKKLAIVND